MSDIRDSINSILPIRDRTPKRRSILVALSGIDGCGKGYLTAKIIEGLKAAGMNAIAIHGDGWLNLPERRFNSDNPGEHFYQNAFRFDEMFSQLVLPLRDRRSIRLEADFLEETDTAYRRHLYQFENVDVIVLEAIYLLQPKFMENYDDSIWIDCGFKTALIRALARNQEGLSEREIIDAYRTVFFPAQIIHFQRDDPKRLAGAIVNNDPEITEFKDYPKLNENLVVGLQPHRAVKRYK